MTNYYELRLGDDRTNYPTATVIDVVPETTNSADAFKRFYSTAGYDFKTPTAGHVNVKLGTSKETTEGTLCKPFTKANAVALLKEYMKNPPDVFTYISADLSVMVSTKAGMDEEFLYSLPEGVNASDLTFVPFEQLVRPKLVYTDKTVDSVHSGFTNNGDMYRPILFKAECPLITRPGTNYKPGFVFTNRPFGVTPDKLKDLENSLYEWADVFASVPVGESAEKCTMINVGTLTSRLEINFLKPSEALLLSQNQQLTVSNISDTACHFLYQENGLLNEGNGTTPQQSQRVFTLKKVEDLPNAGDPSNGFSGNFVPTSTDQTGILYYQGLDGKLYLSFAHNKLDGSEEFAEYLKYEVVFAEGLNYKDYLFTVIAKTVSNINTISVVPAENETGA